MRNAFNVKMKREEKIDLASNKNVYFVLIPISILKKKVYFKILGPRSFHCCYLCVFPFIVALWKIQCKGIFLELQWPFVYVITENFSFYHFCLAMVRNGLNFFFFFERKKRKRKRKKRRVLASNKNIYFVFIPIGTILIEKKCILKFWD